MKAQTLQRLFEPLVPDDRLHPAYAKLRNFEPFKPARELMESLYTRMGDKTGNFARNFQADGFHSHLFELGCFAYLESAGFAIDRTFHAPDFLVATLDGFRLAIEATTSNPTVGQRTDISLTALEEIPEQVVMRKASHEFPLRVLSVLRTKLTLQYHDLPQCRDQPLVLFVAPFFEPGVTTYTDQSLFPVLYGMPGFWDAAKAFFNLQGADHVSGVLFCNGFTVPRFQRAAVDWKALDGLWQGTCFTDEDPGVPYDFSFPFGASDIPREDWHTGVTFFENPNARVRVPVNVLPATCSVTMEHGKLKAGISGFHPVSTVTVFWADPDERTV